MDRIIEAGVGGLIVGGAISLIFGAISLIIGFFEK